MCRRIFMTCLFACILVFGIGAAILGYLYWDITRAEPAAPSGPVSGDSPAPGNAAPGASPSARQTIDRLEEQLSGGTGSEPGGQYRVRITEAEANELINSLPDVRNTLAQYNISNLRVQFEPGSLVAGARVPLFANVRARVAIRGRLYAENGRLAYETESVSAGSFPAPGALREELDRQLQGVIAQLDESLEGEVTHVALTEGVLEIQGARGPK